MTASRTLMGTAARASLATAFIACGATADFTGMSTEANLVDQTGWEDPDARTLYVISVFADFDNALDHLTSVWGDSSHVLSVETSDDDGFWQFDGDGGSPPGDYNTSYEIVAGLSSIYASITSDSFVTIGLTNSTGNVLQNISVDFESFNDASNTSAISVDNGTWFITPDDSQGIAGNYTGNRVLIGQFTVGENETVTGSVSLLWSDAAGDPHYANATAFEGTAAVGGVADRDFNGDGKTDLAWKQISTNKDYIGLMDGLTQASGGFISVGDPIWSIVGYGDFNGDGKTDVVWFNSSNNRHYVDLMDGTTTLSGGYISSGDPSWEVVDYADFNADGMTDVVWLNTSNNRHYIGLMDGTTQTSGGYISSGVGAWEIVNYADFNGDGMTDVVWLNTSNNRHWVGLMDGLTTTTGGYISTGVGTWEIVDYADFNGDGKTDVVWLNTGNNRHWVGLMDGLTTLTGGYISSGMGTWEIVDYGDFNGDGMADVLWLNTANNKYYIGLMNGTTETSGGYFTSGDVDWLLLTID